MHLLYFRLLELFGLKSNTIVTKKNTWYLQLDAQTYFNK